MPPEKDSVECESIWFWNTMEIQSPSLLRTILEYYCAYEAFQDSSEPFSWIVSFQSALETAKTTGPALPALPLWIEPWMTSELFPSVAPYKIPSQKWTKLDKDGPDRIAMGEPFPELVGCRMGKRLANYWGPSLEPPEVGKPFSLYEKREPSNNDWYYQSDPDAYVNDKSLDFMVSVPHRVSENIAVESFRLLLRKKTPSL